MHEIYIFDPGNRSRGQADEAFQSYLRKNTNLMFNIAFFIEQAIYPLSLEYLDETLTDIRLLARERQLFEEITNEPPEDGERFAYFKPHGEFSKLLVTKPLRLGFKVITPSI